MVTRTEYSCVDGYYLDGNSSRECLLSGSWTGVQPKCRCILPSNPVNGAVEYGNSSDNLDTAVHSCSEAPCFALAQPTGGILQYTTDGAVTNAGITCNNGYTLLGAQNLTCRADGSWNFQPGTCVKCPDLEDISSGVLSMSTDGSVSVADYVCASGYDLDGLSEIVCLTDGSWSDQPPVCKCESPPQILHGTYTISSDGQTVTYSCESGSALVGNTSQMCDTAGAGWLGTQPECCKFRELVCDSLTNLANGFINLTTDGRTTSVVFTCEVGNTLAGASVASCQSDGTWDIQQPSCGNGTMTMSSNGTLTLAKHTCDLGFTLVGTDTLVCSESGSWSSSQPVCVACQQPTILENGNFVISTDGQQTTANYSCQSDYTLVGDDVQYCGNDGSWTVNMPTCVCSAFHTPTNGDIEISDAGTTATYTCGEGYTLSGVALQQCGSVEDVLAGNSSPSCAFQYIGNAYVNSYIQVTCSTLDYVSGGNVNISTDGVTTTATFTCEDGYTLQGDSRSPAGVMDHGTCRLQIAVMSCSSLAQPSGGSLIYSTDGTVSTVTVICDVGSTLNGAQYLTCRSDGSWNILPGTCGQLFYLQLNTNKKENNNFNHSMSMVKCPSFENPDSARFPL
ncbi:SVEP1-like protein [Mya arenaria]|uniref:SVEP1-like protein n=1 Tax=Mya arenaria TaxID=6604 RepID=A0ABY7DNM5_MYAAR|nr:SVEP1-like protein [Mya arenaria]